MPDTGTPCRWPRLLPASRSTPASRFQFLLFLLSHTLRLRPSGNNPAALAAFEASEEASVGGQAQRFGTRLPSARVVRLRHAIHYVFLSNEADVLREMNAFLSSLPVQ